MWTSDILISSLLSFMILSYLFGRKAGGREVSQEALAVIPDVELGHLHFVLTVGGERKGHVFRIWPF